MSAASPDTVSAGADIDPESLRANTYGLLASLLRSPPDRQLLDAIASFESAAQPRDSLGQSWLQLRTSAAEATPEQLDDEFHQLFIGIGHGEVIPYGSWYQTGYLMDKPLAMLRQDLTTLGITRQENIHEPEDHIAAVFESMAILITSQASLALQQGFFHQHLQCWIDRCLRDIEQAASAQFYQSVAILCRHFIELEARYLDDSQN